ncbi:hypothetical protein Emin_0737 [Elusimicrobium minutum Pei191]|uniref:Uncharacterized protein n=1 Tax=Elusimicrobium minutum (strain Pei191) TaxID=445932 RepID=B2KCP6_ELUMP|nr:hypothetical protein [Elusimicrobium minutum]ACC98292.1 hypothetical protein Emin_0737 [Elusimicrobium minutum Pei191]
MSQAWTIFFKERFKKYFLTAFIFLLAWYIIKTLPYFLHIKSIFPDQSPLSIQVFKIFIFFFYLFLDFILWVCVVNIYNGEFNLKAVKETVKKHYWFFISLLAIKLLIFFNNTITQHFFYSIAAGNEIGKAVYVLQISSVIAGFLSLIKFFIIGWFLALHNSFMAFFQSVKHNFTALFRPALIFVILVVLINIAQQLLFLILSRAGVVTANASTAQLILSETIFFATYVGMTAAVFITLSYAKE